MKRVGILVFDDMELLDATGPYEVFSAASMLHDSVLFETFALSVAGDSVRTINGLILSAEWDLRDHPHIDILVLPGGEGTKEIIGRPEVLRWVRRSAATAEIVFSVCSGARILAAAGLLEGRRCTTHHSVVEDIGRLAPDCVVSREARFVESGKLLTAAGVSAGIDGAFHILRRLQGGHVAATTQVYMEYGRWRAGRG
ncbi:MAG: DJ-1/PfpI family protein [Synergistales bacterium]|nr:DJ-1/PfpI family protein [Synergistales bacterium]